MIERGRGVAVWRQIAEDIERSIAEGSLMVDGRLPSEQVLADGYGVNRHTVRRAIAALTAQGVLEAARGKGTFVKRRPIAYPITPHTRFSEIVSSQNRQPGGRLIGSSREMADAMQAAELGVEPGASLIRLDVLRVVEGDPIALATSWFVANLVPNLIADYAELGSVTKALERAGHGDYRRHWNRISAVRVAAGDRDLLRAEAGAPVLVVDSLNVTAADVPLQLSRTRFAADMVQLVVETGPRQP